MASRESNEERRRKLRIRKARACALVAMAFVFLLAAAAVANLATPDRDYSFSENRYLSSFPEFSLEAVKSGDYMTDFENYVSDQFFLRDQWISLKLGEDLALGKRESNGVYLGSDGYLLGAPGEPDRENLQKNLNAMKDFARRHSKVPVYVCLAPNSFYILRDKLPTGAPIRDQADDLSEISNGLGDSVHLVDVSPILQEHSDEYIYYKTDHHWTTLGAGYAHETLAQEMNLAVPEEGYTTYTVADDFQGTMDSASGYHRSRDTIQICEAADTEYVVLYVEDERKTTSIYESDCLEKKDKYQVFFGGNHPRVDISTTGKEERNLLLFKDSFANCLVQYLLPSFQNIIMVDPRYCYDNMDSIMENQGITDVLFLYNLDTFLTDNSLADVLAEETQ